MKMFWLGLSIQSNRWIHNNYKIKVMFRNCTRNGEDSNSRLLLQVSVHLPSAPLGSAWKHNPLIDVGMLGVCTMNQCMTTSGCFSYLGSWVRVSGALSIIFYFIFLCARNLTAVVFSPFWAMYMRAYTLFSVWKLHFRVKRTQLNSFMFT